MAFDLDVLKINPAQELEKLSKFIMDQVRGVFRRKGIVVGLSGGIDSACMAAVAVHAVGKVADRRRRSTGTARMVALSASILDPCSAGRQRPPKHGWVS